ncbi:hypothetical protein DFJ73DRAFT_831832 [Zopfochytrium polystomum]|nr:hypothetical protein DFJ73DRAFT_831832 [Zopfochytrium polystomum]
MMASLPEPDAAAGTTSSPFAAPPRHPSWTAPPADANSSSSSSNQPLLPNPSSTSSSSPASRSTPTPKSDSARAGNDVRRQPDSDEDEEDFLLGVAKTHRDVFEVHTHPSLHSSKRSRSIAQRAVGGGGGFRRPLWKIVRGWYTPVYDFRTSGLSHKQRKRARYCDGRVSAPCFCCINLCFIAAVLTAIMFPVMLLVIVPKIISDKVNSLDSSVLNAQVMDVLQFTSTGVDFHYKSTLPSFVPLPFWVGLGGMTITFKAASGQFDGVEILSVDVPPLFFKVSDPLELDLNSSVIFPHPERSKELIAAFSSPQGLDSLVLRGESALTITVFGITWIRNFPVRKDIDLAKITTGFADIITGLPQFLKASNLNSIITTEYRAKDLWSLLPGNPLFPLIAFNDIGVGVIDRGPTINASIAFENPTIIQVPIDSVDLGIAINETAISRLSVKGFNLKRLVNKPNLGVSLDFLDSTLPPATDVQNAISSLISEIFSHGVQTTSAISIVGPINIPNADWLSTITEKLALHIKLSDVLNAVNITQITDGGIGGLLSNASIAVDVRDDRIIAPLVIGLPRIIPLPPAINIDDLAITASVATSTTSGTTLQALVSGLAVNTDDSGIYVSVTATVLPNNTVGAAHNLATALNPILRASGPFWSGSSNSSLIINQLGVFNPSSLSIAPASTTTGMPTITKTDYPWSTRSLSGAVIDFGLPQSLGVSGLVNSLTGNGTSLPVNIISVAVTQSSSVPGFDIGGALSVVPSGFRGFPKLRIAAGYVDVGVVVPKVTAGAVDADTQVSFVNVTLPTGLQLNTTDASKSVSLDASAVFSRSDSLTGSLQTTIDSLLGTTQTKSYLGITGIVLGASKTSAIITFSELLVEIGTTDLTGLLGNVRDSLLNEVGGSFLTIDGLDLAVKTSSSISVGVDSILKNPWPLSAKLGGIGLNVLVDGAQFTGVNLDSLSLAQGTAPLDLNVGVTLTTNASSSLTQSVSKLISQVVAGQSVTPKLSISGIVIAPPGGSASSSAAIDQLKSITITLPSSVLDKVVVPSSGTPAVDLSPLVPTEQRVNAMNLALSSLKLTIDASNTMTLAPAATLTNPTNISATVGYASVGVALAGVSDTLTVKVSSLSLAQGRAAMQATLALNFADGSKTGNGTTTADAIAAVVNELTSGGHLTTSIAVGSIAFGSSATDVNNVLKDVTIDITPLTTKITGAGVGNAVKGLLPASFPSTLSNLTDTLGLDITNVGVKAAPSASLSVTAAASLTRLPYTLDIGIGATSLGLGLDAAPLLTAAIPAGVTLNGASSFNLGMSLGFSNDALARSAVKTLVANVLDKGQFGSSAISIGSISLAGVGAPAPITALSKVSVSLKLADLLSFGSKPDLVSLVSDTLGVSVKSADLSTKPNKVLGVGAQVGLGLSFPLSVDIPYLGAGVAFSAGNVVTASSSTGIKLATGGSGLGIGVDLTFDESDSGQTEFANLVNSILAGSNQIPIHLNSVSLGASASDRILTFADADLYLNAGSLITKALGGPIDLNKIVRNVLTNTLSGGNGTTSGNSDNISLSSVAVKAASNSRLQVTANAGLALTLPLAVSANIGSLSLSSFGLGSKPVMALDLGIITFGASQPANSSIANALKLPLATITCSTDDSAAQAVADAFAPYTAGGGSSTSTQTLFVSGIALGASSSDQILAFNKVSVSFAVDSIGTPVSSWVSRELDKFLAGIPSNALSNALNGNRGDGSLLLTLGKETALSLNDLNIGFKPSSVISAAVAAGLQWAWNVGADLPWVGTAISLDSVKAADISISGLSLSGSSDASALHPLSLGANVAISDTDALANSVSTVIDSFFDGTAFPGSMVVSNLGLGSSDSDRITLFSKIVLAISLNRVAQPLIGNLSRNIDFYSLIDTFGIALGKINVQAQKSKSVGVDVAVQFGNKFPLSVSLPYIAATSGFDAVDWLNLNFGKGINLAKGNQTLGLDIGLGFISSQTVQNTVAGFFSDVYTNGWGNTKQVFAISGLALGYSQTDYIKAFSKSRIKLKTSSFFSKQTVDWLVGKLGFPGGTTDFNNADAVLSRIDLVDIIFDIGTKNIMTVNCTVDILNVPFDLTVFFPVFAMNVKINGADLTYAKINNLLVVPNFDRKAIRATLLLEMTPSTGADVQAQVAKVVSEMQVGGNAVAGIFAGTNLRVGVSDNDADVIDTFSAMVGELNLVHATVPGTALFKSLLSTLGLDDVVIKILGEKTLGADVQVSMTQSLKSLNGVIPYLHIDTELNGVIIASLDVRNVIYKNGAITANATIEFPFEFTTLQRFCDVITNILFRRAIGPINDKVYFKNIYFGSEKNPLVFVQSTQVLYNVAGLVNDVSTYFSPTSHPLELVDIHTVLAPNGVTVECTGVNLPAAIPFRNLADAGASVEVMYSPGGVVQDTVFMVYFHDMYFVPNEPMKFKIDVVAQTTGAAFADIVPRLVKWTNYVENISVGRVTLSGGDIYSASSTKFMSFKELIIPAQALYFYTPLTIKPKLTLTLEQGLGILIDVYFSNPGPLRLELGNIGVYLKDRDETIGNVTIGLNTINKQQGGMGSLANKVSISVYIKLDPLLIPQNLWDLITGGKNYKLQWFSFKPDMIGGPSAQWLVDILTGVPQDLVSNLIPIIMAVLGNIDIKLGSLDINLANLFHNKASEIRSWSGNNVIYSS